jgi:hypothetical protein
MKPRKAKEIISVLQRKGFVPASGDHTFLFLHVNGKKSSVRTKVSHGSGEYGDNLLKHVARQLWLSNNELDQLFDCPLTAERYVEILFEKNILKK